MAIIKKEGREEKMEDILEFNGERYQYLETFDTNLTLDYENQSWGAWEIFREFLSNALDGAGDDREKVEIKKSPKKIIIENKGPEYPLVYAKRIGASTKKESASSIGQFGEGTKIALLTCLREDISVAMGSGEWLIVPEKKEVENQEVMFYSIYKTDKPYKGSFVEIGSTEEMRRISESLPEYFLHFTSGEERLFGDSKRGIYKKKNTKAGLYNKGVYIRSVKALFSYAVSLGTLNRDRDIVDQDRLEVEIARIWKEVDDKNLIRRVIKEAGREHLDHKRELEMVIPLKTDYPELWRQAFYELYGRNACINTDDIAAREAKELGYSPVRLEFLCARLLEEAGVKTDEDVLPENYEFVWSRELTEKEKAMLDTLKVYAEVIGFPQAEKIRVFDEYKNWGNVEAAYNQNVEEVYLKRSLLGGEKQRALEAFLHELNHHETGEDDLSRKFAENILKKLVKISQKYMQHVVSC